MGKDAFLYIEYYGIDNYKNEGWHSVTHILTDRSDARELYRVFSLKKFHHFCKKGVPRNAGGQVVTNYTQLITNESNLHRFYPDKYISDDDFEQFKKELLYWDELPTRVYMDNLIDTWLTISEIDNLAEHVMLQSVTLKLKACSSMMRVLADGNEENARLILWIN